MKARYTADTAFTMRNFTDLFRAISRKKNHFWLKHGILEAVILLGAALSYFIWHYNDIALMFILTAALYPLFVRSMEKMNITKQWKTMRRRWGQESTLEFYDEYFEQIVNGNSSRFGYYELSDILETGTHFHLMIGRTNGISVEKAACTDGLIAFLQEQKKQMEGK